jgi:DDE superfamily endonuclease/Helix-turn-helix of DDE superfamily endonuclease
MITYTEIQKDRRKCLALTGLTLSEFERLAAAFAGAYERLHPSDQTAVGRPRQRRIGAGRQATLQGPQQKLLFLLVYLKTYPLQVIRAELFDLSQSSVNYWLRRLLPVLLDALDELDVLPQRDARSFAQTTTASEPTPSLIIDGTERRRQRPKNPEKQALHYSGRKKTHNDKNVIVVEAGSERVGFLSQTYPGRAADKAIADHEDIAYPPGSVLYKDSGFQGYEPERVQTRQAKKKATRQGTDGGRKAHESKMGTGPSEGGTRLGRSQTLPHRHGCAAEWRE